MCFIYKTAFDIKHNHNLLYCDKCLYKHTNFSDDISQVNSYSIRKNHFLNYFIQFEYKTLLVDEFLGNKLGRRNVRPILFLNQI